MSDAISALSRALNNDMEQMRSVSQNMANINTQGYKREITSVSTFQQALRSTRATADSAASVNDALSGMPRIEVHRDMTQGALKYSGSAFDIALKGDGFLEIETPRGTQYTRKGSLKIDEQGRLALVTGEPVMGESGAIYLRNGPFEISDEGLVTQDDTTNNRLKVVSFQQVENLEYLGRGLFALPANTPLTRLDFTGVVMQGYLESSNVQSLDEMVNIIETTRHFETSQRVLRGYDAMLDRSINVLGDL
jgi:flagellar basal body rod protein FlgG